MPLPYLTYSPIGTDWPRQVKTPGNRDWERSAAKWLRELVPSRYGSYPLLVRRPVLLARHAQIQLQQEIRVVRTALHSARAELPALGMAEPVIEHTIRMYAAELTQLNHLARGVRVITQALMESHPARQGH